MLTKEPVPADRAEPNAVLERTLDRFRALGIALALPRVAEVADPTVVPPVVRNRLGAVGPDDASLLNLFRVNWFNDATCRGLACVPGHVVPPPAPTGVEAQIVHWLEGH